jgi:hypothetical protein
LTVGLCHKFLYEEKEDAEDKEGDCAGVEAAAETHVWSRHLYSAMEHNGHWMRAGTTKSFKLMGEENDIL